MAIINQITLINGIQVSQEVYSKYIFKDEGLQVIELKKYVEESEYSKLFEEYVIGKIYNVCFDNRINTSSILKNFQIVSINESPIYLLIEFEVIKKI